MVCLCEDKIQRLESLTDEKLSVESYLNDENKMLEEELQIMQRRIECNPKLAQFSIDNLHLAEQLKRYSTSSHFQSNSCHDTFPQKVPTGTESEMVKLVLRNKQQSGIFHFFCRYQDFYASGERETLLQENLDLRNQVRKRDV